MGQKSKEVNANINVLHNTEWLLKIQKIGQLNDYHSCPENGHSLHCLDACSMRLNSADSD